MHPLSIKQRIRNRFDKLFHIDRKNEYGYMAKNAYLNPDTIVFNKKNLFMYENTGIPGGAMILISRSKFIMEHSSLYHIIFVYVLAHMSLIGKWKHDVTDAMKD